MIPTDEDASIEEEEPEDSGTSKPDASLPGKDADPQVDSGPPDTGVDAADANPPPTGPQVVCHALSGPSPTCDINDVCCVGLTPYNGSGTCQAKAKCDNQNAATILECDGPEDCTGGKVCCGYFAWEKTRYLRVSCQAQADCKRDGPGNDGSYIFCHPNEKACPPGTKCSASATLPGHYTCDLAQN